MFLLVLELKLEIGLKGENVSRDLRIQNSVRPGFSCLGRSKDRNETGQNSNFFFTPKARREKQAGPGQAERGACSKQCLCVQPWLCCFISVDVSPGEVWSSPLCF